MSNIERIVGNGELSATIYLSDGSTLHLPKEIVYDKGLRKGDSLDELLMAELQTASVLYSIRNSALKFLTIRRHSTSELSLKLRKKKFDPPLIKEALKSLTDAGMLNDADFAKAYAAEALHYKRDGVQKVKANLLKRGISKSIIETVLADYVQEDTYFSGALDIAEKKLKILLGRKYESKKIQESLFRYLLGKGFNVSTIKSVVNELKEKYDGLTGNITDYQED